MERDSVTLWRGHSRIRGGRVLGERHVTSDGEKFCLGSGHKHEKVVIAMWSCAYKHEAVRPRPGAGAA